MLTPRASAAGFIGMPPLYRPGKPAQLTGKPVQWQAPPHWQSSVRADATASTSNCRGRRSSLCRRQEEEGRAKAIERHWQQHVHGDATPVMHHDGYTGQASSALLLAASRARLRLQPPVPVI